MTCKVYPLIVDFLFPWYCKILTTILIFCLACFNKVLNCKSAHLIFCQEKFCSETVFHEYLRQFDGVVAMVT